jgi:mono/diheme cytochrome c family protein
LSFIKFYSFLILAQQGKVDTNYVIAKDNLQRSFDLSKNHISVALSALIIMLSFSVLSASAEEKKVFVPVEFSSTYLADPTNFENGKEIWFDQCTHCHGYKAYPGKAPKLKPKRYKPSFVYKRVTKGFRKMPAWDEVYDKDERMAIVAYIMHKDFSP